jgi:hypothetical protein
MCKDLLNSNVAKYLNSKQLEYLSRLISNLKVYGLACQYFNPFSHFRHSEAVSFIRKEKLLSEATLNEHIFFNGDNPEMLEFSIGRTLGILKFPNSNVYFANTISKIVLSGQRALIIVGNCHVDEIRKPSEVILGLKPLLRERGYGSVIGLISRLGDVFSVQENPRVPDLDYENAFISADYLVNLPLKIKLEITRSHPLQRSFMSFTAPSTNSSFSPVDVKK